MASGFNYKLNAPQAVEERYSVKTGERRIGAYKLVNEHIPEGVSLPSFMPICADLKNKFAYPVINVEVAVKFETGTNTTLKIKKGSFPYVGMILGTGAKGAEVAAIDKSGADFDVVTLRADFGVNIEAGTVLFEATAAGGTKQKYVANSALYERKVVESGIMLVALLRTAAEIEPSKLEVPFSTNDKDNMKGWFEFNE